MKGKSQKPEIGFGKPIDNKYMIKDHAPVFICNITDLEKVTDKEKQVAVISSSVGLRNALKIAEQAKKNGVNISNLNKIRRAEKKQRILRRIKEAKQKLKEETKKKVVEKKEEQPKKDEIRHEEEKTEENKSDAVVEQHKAKSETKNENIGETTPRTLVEKKIQDTADYSLTAHNEKPKKKPVKITKKAK